MSSGFSVEIPINLLCRIALFCESLNADMVADDELLAWILFNLHEKMRELDENACYVRMLFAPNETSRETARLDYQKLYEF
jgi:hypothetical protein